MAKAPEYTREYPYTQNRELSWLRFNQRVLEEAADPSVPLLERLQFISIFSSNLDEFFMVRVGSLFDIARVSPGEVDNKTGWTAMEQLERIYATIPGLIALKKQIYQALMEELKVKSIEDVEMSQLTSGELKLANRYFRTSMMPVLSPIIVGPRHPVPHLVGKKLHAAALLEDKKGRWAIGLVPLPESLPPYLLLSERGGRYIRMENLLLHWLPKLFGTYALRESCVLCVTRNADISFDDEKFEDNEEDFRRQIKKLLKKRDNLSVVRLELDRPVQEPFRSRLAELVQVSRHQIFVDTCPLNMKYTTALTNDLPQDVTAGLKYRPYIPRWPEDVSRDQRLIPQIQKRDQLLYYPYDSAELFLKLLSEAAEDPNVLSIKITIYRLATSSRIAHTLCRAAENGKDVLVLMELRARFDEENNLAWSETLESAGCHVIYGMEGFKCHSKICLITLRSRGRIHYITQIGTGNYNEKTNTAYTDLCFMTASEVIGEDAVRFFRNMLVNELSGAYRALSVSPQGIKDTLLEQIDGQIRKGKEGYICIKANSVTEREVMDKLCEASRAGVEIRLIIRGICCILPGISGYTENIQVVSLVGRFLEHARIYLFGRGGEQKVYISSADLMTRNLNRRVEIACPVYDPALKERLKKLLDTQLRDTAKASFMLSDGSYSRKHGTEALDSQTYFMEHSPHIPQAATEKREPLLWRLWSGLLAKIKGK